MSTKTRAKWRASKTRSRGADEMVIQIRQAWQQFDSEPGGALGWLVRFVREDAGRWLPGEQESNGCRLLALVYGRMGPGLLRLTDDIVPMAPFSVEETQGELRDFLHELVTVPFGWPGVQVPTDQLVERLIRTTDPGKKPAAWGLSRGGLRRTLLFQAVKELVFATDRLVACPQCKRPILALRKKKFCDSTCLQRWWDKKRQKKGGAR